MADGNTTEFKTFFEELDKEISSLESNPNAIAALESPPQSPPQSPPANSPAPGEVSVSAPAVQKSKLQRPVSQRLNGVFKHKGHIGFDKISGELILHDVPPEFQKKAADLIQRVNKLDRITVPDSVSFEKKTSLTSEVMQEMAKSNPNSVKGWLNPTANDEEKMRLQRLVNVNKAMMDFELEETMASMDSMIKKT
jgi:hypothetical protein